MFYFSAQNDGKIPEWGLMEFQGSFESREEGGPLFEQYLGDLNYTKDVSWFLMLDYLLDCCFSGDSVFYKRASCYLRRGSQIEPADGGDCQK